MVHPKSKDIFGDQMGKPWKYEQLHKVQDSKVLIVGLLTTAIPMAQSKLEQVITNHIDLMFSWK